jgi:protein-tyrosine phosphatase
MEATLCGQNEIEFLSFPIPDRGLPKDADVAMSFAAYVASKSITIAIHCRAEIGRSSVMAAAVFNLLKAPRPQQRYRQSKRREACIFPTKMLNAIES